jgi:hypothetical protein
MYWLVRAGAAADAGESSRSGPTASQPQTHPPPHSRPPKAAEGKERPARPRPLPSCRRSRFHGPGERERGGGGVKADTRGAAAGGEEASARLGPRPQGRRQRPAAGFAPTACAAGRRADAGARHGPRGPAGLRGISCRSRRAPSPLLPPRRAGAARRRLSPARTICSAARARGEPRETRPPLSLSPPATCRARPAPSPSFTPPCSAPHPCSVPHVMRGRRRERQRGGREGEGGRGREE